MSYKSYLFIKCHIMSYILELCHINPIIVTCYRLASQYVVMQLSGECIFSVQFIAPAFNLVSKPSLLLFALSCFC
jgi:hypothetical protein